MRVQSRCATLVLLFAAACDRAPEPASAALALAAQDPRGFELWVVDQSGTEPGNPSGPGGTLHVFEGADLLGDDLASVTGTRIDLATLGSGVCAATGKAPVRPHMLLFNEERTHAVLSFVGSGHVVLFDAERREPLSCFLMSQSATGQQAHAAVPAPDGTFIIVANQSGKRLERINTDYVAGTFAHDTAATLDLATCTTPSGAPCEDSELRPMNWPICPIIDASSALTYVTLRGGGLLVVDARRTPMAIVGEYDRATVKGNGCGGVQVGDRMYLNSGGSPVNVSGGDPHHPALYGFDVYGFPTSGYTGAQGANLPAPQVLFTKGGASDSHGMAPVAGGRYLWVMDRHGDVGEIIDPRSGEHVGSVALNGPLTSNAAPDLVDVAPAGDRLFVALRGTTPLSGDPHNATGASPGVGVIRITEDGRGGELVAIVRIDNAANPGATDPHAIRVRLRR